MDDRQKSKYPKKMYQNYKTVLNNRLIYLASLKLDESFLFFETIKLHLLVMFQTKLKLFSKYN